MTPTDCLKIIRSRMAQEAQAGREHAALALFAVASEISETMRSQGHVSETEIALRQQLIRQHGMWPPVRSGV